MLKLIIMRERERECEESRTSSGYVLEKFKEGFSYCKEVERLPLENPLK